MTVTDFSRGLGLEKGVGGYVFQTVPVALYACMQHSENFEAALCAALSCGGDTDTVGAIVGAILGARLGASKIPLSWVDTIVEWPRSVAFIRQVSKRNFEVAQSGSKSKEVAWFWPGVIFRNIIFLVIVLAHGFRRLFPPY